MESASLFYEDGIEKKVNEKLWNFGLLIDEHSALYDKALLMVTILKKYD